LGGEKLNRFRFVIIAALMAASTISILSAQTQDPSGNLSDESIVQSSPEAYTIDWGDTPSDTPVQGTSSIFVVIRMVLVLALVAAAIYGIVFLFKRAARPQAQTDPHLKVLARTQIGPGCFATVVSVGAKAWLVGGSDSGGVSLISELTEQEAVDAMLLDESRKTAEASPRFLDFSAMLRRLGGGDKGSTFPSPDSLRKRRERLKGL
jgi:flagellar protein FliO/FliZ